MTFGDGGAPERSSASRACEMIRDKAGSDLTSERVSAVSSRGAVRNAVLTVSNSETRFVVCVNCLMNGRAARSVACISTRLVAVA